MRYYLNLGFGLLSAVCSPVLQAQHTVDVLSDSIICRPHGWNLVFEDHFDKKVLNTDAWYRYFPYGSNASDSCRFCRTHAVAADGEGQVYLDHNVAVSEGVLRLRLTAVDTSWFDFDRRYTSGMVHSKAAYTNFARFAIRCRVPLTKGVWPAFWMFGGSTELDVFEYYGTKGRSQRSLDRYEASVHY